MYRATVDPNYMRELGDSYDKAVATGDLNWKQYISRLTEIALRDAAEVGQILADAGFTDAQLAMLNMNPLMAEQMMGALLLQNYAETGTYLSLDEVLTAFQFAAIGSAASEAGLELPGKERIDELIKVGVTRAQAIRGYTQFSNQRGLMRAMAARTGLADDFSQDDFEKAAMIGKGRTVDLLARMIQQEDALGRQRGSYGMERAGRRVEQLGRRFD